MPAKFRPTVVKAVKKSNGTIEKTNEHSYLRNASIKDILERYHNTSTPGKIRDKMQKELVARGYFIGHSIPAGAWRVTEQ